MKTKKSEHSKEYHLLLKTEQVVDEEALEKEFILKNVKDFITSKELVAEQIQIFADYYKFIIAGGSKIKSAISIRNVFSDLSHFARHIKKPFNRANREDIINYSAYMFEKGLKDNTINARLIKVKQLYFWLGLPEIVEWIKIKQTKLVLEESQLITPEEIKLMVSKCDNPRDKAIIMSLYESASRISELLGVKIKNVIVDDFGIKIEVNGKTGRREIRLIDSVPYLQDWINNHPFADNPESYLFFSFSKNQYGRKLKYQGVRDLLLKAKKMAKIQKAIRPHLFRHSRLNQLAKQNFNERDLRLIAGWSENSDMPRVYLHYQQDVVDRKLLKIKGIIKDKQSKPEKVLEAKKCARCGNMNPATSRYCGCGMALDLKAVIQDKKKIDTETSKTIQFLMEMAKNPELMKRFEEFKKTNI